MDRGWTFLAPRKGAPTILLAVTLLILPACQKPTFEENYRAGLDEMKAGRYDRAQMRLHRAFLQSPNNIEAHYQLAMADLKLLDRHAAYVVLHDAEEKDKFESSTSVALRLELAKLYIADKRYEEAQRRLLWVLEKHPENKEARALLAAVFSYLSQPNAAREQVDVLLAEDPKDSSGRVLDVALHLAFNQTMQAEDSLLEEVTLTQRSIESLTTLARFYGLLEKPAKAIPLLQEVVQRDSQNIAVRQQLGWAYAQAGDHANAEKTFREMAQIAPQDKSAVMALANYYMNITDWAKATTELERLLKKDSDVQTRNLLAAVYYRNGRQVDAQKMAEQLIKEDRQDTNARMLTGVIHMDKREYQQASMEFDQVLHFVPDSAGAYFFLAQASYGQGKEQLAQQQMEKALNFKKELLPARVWLIDFNLKRGSNSVALDLARGASGRQAYAPEIVILKAVCEPLAPLDDEQQKALLRALLLRPQFITEYENLGMFTLLRRYGNPFRDPLEKVAKKRPEIRSIQALLMTILDAQGKQDQMIARVQKKLAEDPNAPVVLLALAKLQMGRGDLKSARTSLERAIAVSPGDPALIARMSELEVKSGNLDAAMTRLNDLTNRYPKFSEGFSFKAIVCEQLKEPREARALYEQALKLDDHNAVAANNLAWLLAISFEEPQDGLELARTAHRLDPGNADFADTLGWIQFLLGNYAGAMEASGDAVRLRPDDGGLRYHLGMAQSRAGRNAEARATLKTALILNPTLPEAPQVRDELVGLANLAARVGAVR